MFDPRQMPIPPNAPEDMYGPTIPPNAPSDMYVPYNLKNLKNRRPAPPPPPQEPAMPVEEQLGQSGLQPGQIIPQDTPGLYLLVNEDGSFTQLDEAELQTMMADREGKSLPPNAPEEMYTPYNSEGPREAAPEVANNAAENAVKKATAFTMFRRKKTSEYIPPNAPAGMYSLPIPPNAPEDMYGPTIPPNMPNNMFWFKHQPGLGPGPSGDFPTG